MTVRIVKRKQYLGLTQAGHTEKALVVLNGHDTRHHRYLDANLTTVVHELQIDVGVIEQLRYNNFRACINLIIQKSETIWLIESARHNLKSYATHRMCGIC